MTRQLTQRKKQNSLEKRFSDIEFNAPKGPAEKLHYEFFKNFDSHETRRAYKSDLKQFTIFFKKAFHTSLRHPKQVERFHIVAYKEYLSKYGGVDDEPASPKTIGRKIGALNTYFKFLIEKDILKTNPCEAIRRPRQVVKSETNALSDDQVKDLLTSLKSETLTQVLHKAILYTLFGTGIRVSELINLKREDFGKTNGLKVIRFKAKGGKFRTLPLRHEISKEIETYIRFMTKAGRKHSPKDPLFQPSQNRHTGELIKPMNRSSILRILKNHCQKIGIFDRVSPHSARATLISSLLDKGVDLYKVSLAAGHANPKTTKLYDKRDKRLEDSAILELNYFE